MVAALNQTPEVIRVAHSPDSDDAFMFYGLAHNHVDTEGLTFSHQLTDIETLNREALKGTYEMTAVSYYAYPFIKDKYALMNVGSSIGEKYGPVVISTKPMHKEDLAGKPIAVPGKMTSAYLFTKLWFADAVTVEVPFQEIMDRVRSGEFEAGVIIHEGQLTYREEGFHKIVDLGEWWFETTNLPLPLGGNAIRKDLGAEMIQKIGRVLRRSIEYSLAHREEALDYALQFARGLDRSKADQFVGMYVNEQTLETSDDVRRAIRLMLNMAYGIDLLEEKVDPEFVDIPQLATC